MKQENKHLVENQQDEVWNQVKAKMKEATDSEENKNEFIKQKIKNILKGDDHKSHIAKPKQ